MSKAKIAITIKKPILAQIDRLVAEHMFPSRSQAIEAVLEEQLQRLDRGRLARECAKLDTTSEQALADEVLAQDFSEWPEY